MRISDWSSDVCSSDLRIERPFVATRSFAFQGGAAMLLCGLAMQVKPTALLPGGFLGMTLLWCAWRAGLRWRPVTGLAIYWILLALLPLALRPEERRVGTGCVSTCSFRW